MPRLAALLAAAGLALAGLPAVAAAQTPVTFPAAGNYGGGAVPLPPRDPYGPGAMTIGMRAPGDGTVKFVAEMGAACALGAFATTVTPAPDGTFTSQGTTRRRAGDTTIRTSWRLSGGVGATGGGGRASATVRTTTRGRTRTCRTGAVNWRARRSTAGVGAEGRPSASEFRGTTSQRHRGPRRGVVLRVSEDGDTLRRALAATTLECPRSRRTFPIGFDAPQRNLTIRTDGTVRNVERTRIRQGAYVARSTEIFTGRFGSTGAAGVLRITSSIYLRGRLVDRCGTGRITWTAAPL